MHNTCHEIAGNKHTMRTKNKLYQKKKELIKNMRTAYKVILYNSDY